MDPEVTCSSHTLTLNFQVITDAFKAIGLMIASRNKQAAKPSWREANGKTKPVPWSDHFIDEVIRGLRACKVFVFYPIFWVCYGQFSSNFVSQAAQMEGHGVSVTTVSFALTAA